MGRSDRTSTTAILLVCLLATQWTVATVFASEEDAASGATSIQSIFRNGVARRLQPPAAPLSRS
jgi:hypothetical protein